MGKARPTPALEPHEALQTEISELRTEVANLRAFVQVANEIFEGIREDLQWLTQNGIEIREPLGQRLPIPVLKGMALDPAGDDWGEKLDINYGLKSSRPDDASSIPAESPSQPCRSPESSSPDDESQPSVVESTTQPTSHELLPKTDDNPSPPRPRDRLF